MIMRAWRLACEHEYSGMAHIMKIGMQRRIQPNANNENNEYKTNSKRLITY